MKNKLLKIISFGFQGLYTLACVVMMILSGVFHNSLGTDIALELLDVLLDMSAWLLVIPAMPVGLLLNILAFPRGHAKEKTVKWLIWTLVSPILYIAAYLIALSAFLSAAGL